MFKFYLRVLVYFISFLVTLFGLSAFDYGRFIRRGRIVQAWILYFVLAFGLAYLLGSFLLSIIYYFQM